MSSENILDRIISQTKLSKKTTDKQQRIVENAIKMFAEKGYANTSTSEIAKASGVAEATIFRHYGTKDNLLLSVILPFLKDLFPSLAEEFVREIPLEKYTSFEGFLKGLVNNRFHFIKENKEVFKIVVKEILYREDFRKELFQLGYKSEVFNHIVKAIEHFKERGQLVDLPVETIIRLMLTFLGGYFSSRFILFPENYIVDEELEIERIIHFMMNGLRPNV
ncbi:MULTISPECIES: TetR/AcrR family transcriptional regulator [Bacillus]|uniref:TetR/AcrR family transcriptional regulator n=1 Tax=Bacillus TaxID=1386 RepID=UPI0002F94715|nr:MULTISPECIES: TetR/AcrR family transcriptional regulator [Bacillus]